MSLVLDSSVLIDLERGFQPTIEKLRELSSMYPSRAQTTFMNEFEILLGIAKKNLKNKQKAIDFLRNFPVLHTGTQTAKILSSLKTNYEERGIRLPLADLLIASLVMEHGKILVTKDRDFEQIVELRKVII